MIVQTPEFLIISVLVKEGVFYYTGAAYFKRVAFPTQLFRCKLLHMEFTFHKKLEDIRSKSSSNDKVTSNLVLDEGEKLVFSGTEARVIYTKAVANHPEFSIAKHFYGIAAKFPFAKDIREEIYR